jgi:thiol reductant ABC exporter CydC subunit
VALMGLSAYLISKAAIASSVAELALAVTGVRVLAISRAGLRYLERYTTHRAMFRILVTIRAWFYATVEPLAPARLGQLRSGDLMTRLVNDVDAMEELYIRVLLPPLVAALVIGATSVLYAVLDVAMGLLLLAFLLFAGVVLPLVTRWLSEPAASSQAGLRGEVAAQLLDEIRGAGDLLALDAAEAHREQLLARGAELDAVRRRMGAIEAVSDALAGLVAGLAGLTILVLAIPLVSGGRLEGVFLAALPLAAIAAFEAVQPLSRSLQLLDATRASARRLFAIVDAPPAVVDPPRPMEPPRRDEPEPRPTFRPPFVAVKGLSFRYSEEEPWVLRDVDLSLAPGERVALVGPSGCGKSTLLALLVRFWDYTSGSIRVDGVELRDLAQESARARFSVVPQDVHLFDATIRDNLAVADGTADLEAMETACRMAQLHDLVAALPAGYDTLLGENGVRLSGGERRRLAIARAVLRDAPVALLDEVTADLDVVTAARLWHSLEPWLSARSVLLIAHEPAGLPRLDRVVVLPAHHVIVDPPEA